MEKFLRGLYKKYLAFERKYFVLDAKKHSTSLNGLNMSKKILLDFYENYYRVPFLVFLQDIKAIIYSDNAFDFIIKKSLEDWDLWRYLRFLEKEKIIKVKKNGKVFLLKKQMLSFFPKPQTAKQIKEKISAKLKIKVKEKEPIINIFENIRPFKVKAKWDQMPISAGSAFFVAEKILSYLPKNKKFLFVGDDDFISVVLTLADPNIGCLAVDADQQVLDCISVLSKKFNLKIETKKIDLTKTKSLGEKFIGFLANPVYTEAGVKGFVKFGLSQLGPDGGTGFLEVGDEAIGNRFLFLQEFFSKNNLVIKELIKARVYYPHIMLYKEDQEILTRLCKMIDKKTIKKSPKLGADLYIFNYLPKRPKEIKFKKSIYAYL